MGYVSTLMSIQSAFEKAGIIFQDKDSGGGIDVRLKALRRQRHEAAFGSSSNRRAQI